MLNILAQHAAQHAKKAFSTCIQQKTRQNKCQQMQIFSKMHQIWSTVSHKSHRKCHHHMPEFISKMWQFQFCWGAYSAPQGSGTFRSPVFYLLGAKVPTGNIRSLERKFPGTFAPRSKSSRELSFQGANVPRNIRSVERYTGDQTVWVTTSVHNAIY